MTNQGRMSNRHVPYKLGYRRATMVITKKSEYESMSKLFKNYPISNYSLQVENMKMKSLVIVNENVTVNRLYF